MRGATKRSWQFGPSTCHDLYPETGLGWSRPPGMPVRILSAATAGRLHAVLPKEHVGPGRARAKLLVSEPRRRYASGDSADLVLCDMTHGTVTILRLRSLGCWLGIALCHAGLTAGAHASCGDYVTVGGRASSAHGADGEQAMPGLHHTMTPTGGSPCSGPHCSRRQQAPDESPAPVLSITVHDWLVAVESSDAEPMAPLGVVSLSQEARCFLWATGIFRPPR